MSDSPHGMIRADFQRHLLERMSRLEKEVEELKNPNKYLNKRRVAWMKEWRGKFKEAYEMAYRDLMYSTEIEKYDEDWEYHKKCILNFMDSIYKSFEKNEMRGWPEGLEG